MNGEIIEFSKKVMTYSAEHHIKPLVKISQGFNKVILVSKNENHLIECSEPEAKEIDHLKLVLGQSASEVSIVSDRKKEKKWTTKKIRGID